MKLGEVQRVLQTLLREQVSIRQLGPILETLGDYAARTKDTMQLAERVRQRLGRSICVRYRDAGNRLHVVTLDPALEERILAGVERGEEDWNVRLSPRDVEEICLAVEREVQKLTAAGRPAIALVGQGIRAAFKQLTATHLPHLIVLGTNEITRDTKIESAGMAVVEVDSGQSAVGSYRQSA